MPVVNFEYIIHTVYIYIYKLYIHIICMCIHREYAKAITQTSQF